MGMNIVKVSEKDKEKYCKVVDEMGKIFKKFKLTPLEVAYVIHVAELTVKERGLKIMSEGEICGSEEDN
jgi:hypothetical protein